MNSSPTTTGPTSHNHCTPPFILERGTSRGISQRESCTNFDGFEFDWPGRERWAVMLDCCREHFFAVEEWWTVKRTGSGELGISPPPTLLPMDDDERTPARPRQTAEQCYDEVSFSTSWTLLAG